MEPLAVAHNDGLAPIVGWTDPSPVDSPLKSLKRTPPPALVIASSPTPSAISSGIEPDADKSTTPSISTYSPTSSIVESEPLFGSTTDCVDNNNVSTLNSKDGNILKTKKLISSLKPNNNLENSPYPSSQCIHVNEGVKFSGIPDHDSICSVSYNGNDSDDDHKDDDEIEGPKVPDGGWGWMIVAASLVLSTIADGVSFSFGLLYIEFLQYFGESKSKTSWIGGLFMSVPLMSGPIMSALVDKYGCRKITILGGLVSAFGFVMATFCNSIEMLLLTFGTIAGLGLGMCYVTAVVSIAYWFDKKRTLAVSLGACGTGIGTFVYAPLTQYLINEYGWRGTVLVLAGTFLNMCVCGAVMRDPEWWTLEQKKQTALSNKCIYGASSCGSVSRLSGGGESVFPGVDELRSLMKSGETPEYILTTLATSIAVAEKLENIPEEKNEQLYNSVVNLPTFVRQNEKVPLEVLESLSSNTKLYNVILENYPSLLTCRSCSENKLNKLPPNKPVTKVPVTMSMRLKASKKTPLKNNEYVECNREIINTPLLTEEKILKPIIKQSSVKSPIKTQEPWLIRQFSTNQHYLRDIKMHRNSVMYRGAMMNIAKYKLRASSCPNIYRNSMIHIDYEDETKWYSNIMETINSTFDFQMFLEFHFLLMSLGTMLLFICFIVPYFCIAEHMTRNGYDEDDGAMQISIIGITNTIGMIFLGWAGDQPWMNVTKSYAVCLVLCGIATLAYPFVINSYYLLITMSILFGLTFASSFSFTPVILVELIPLERFTTAYGLILLCQGIGNLLGPPISGWLFDVTQSWDLSFYLAGIFTMLAGVLVGIIPFTKNFRIWGSAPLEKDLEKISQMSQKDSISIA